MAAVLLDSNVLIAVVVADHVHHAPAELWLAKRGNQFATCPITQGSLLRLLLRHGVAFARALEVLKAVTSESRHEFWPDDQTYEIVPVRGIAGHRQVTDAYLAQLARSRGGRLATFDRGLADVHHDVADVVPVGSAPSPPHKF